MRAIAGYVHSADDGRVDIRLANGSRCTVSDKRFRIGDLVFILWNYEENELFDVWTEPQMFTEDIRSDEHDHTRPYPHGDAGIDERAEEFEFDLGSGVSL